MIHFAFREEQRFEKEAENFQKLFEEIRNDLKNCSFTPDRFRLFVYKIFSAIYNSFSVIFILSFILFNDIFLNRLLKHLFKLKCFIFLN